MRKLSKLMKRLDHILPTWSQILPASKRFKMVMDGAAVLDKETGLNWLANVSPSGSTAVAQDWAGAICWLMDANFGGRKGWRLPSIEELASLVDPSQTDPALPSGFEDFFDNVRGASYWTSNRSVDDDAWTVDMSNGQISRSFIGSQLLIWPVRFRSANENIIV